MAWFLLGLEGRHALPLDHRSTKPSDSLVVNHGSMMGLAEG